MIYFDNAATSWPKPPEVLTAMKKCMDEQGGNPGRSGHKMAVGAEALLTQGRNAISKYFGLTDPERCVFTLNCTDSLNLGIKGILRKGDHAISSVLEHNSVNRPLQHLADDEMIELTRIDADESGAWTVDDVLSSIKDNTRLIAITHCSNVLGVVCPVQELAAALKKSAEETGKQSPILLVDAAQSAGIVPINMEEWGIDLLAFPGHKALFGPTGTGVLLVGPGITFETLTEWREGGTGGDSSSPRQPQEAPHFYEGGTPNTVGVAGLLAGVQYLENLGKDKVLDHERKIVGQLIDKLKQDDRFEIKGTTDLDKKVGAVSITVRDFDTTELATLLDQAFDIAVRPGLHCAPYNHKALGTFPNGTLRLSPGLLNKEEEVDQVVNALIDITN